MKLAAYLKHRGRGAAADLARQLGVRPISVYRWRDDKAKPMHKGLMEKIIKATGGKVRPSDFYSAADGKRVTRG